MNEEKMIYCSRCGELMKASSRYCMKCGNLNYDHPDNKNMQKFKVQENNAYQVGSGNFILGSVTNQEVTQSIANNTGNKTLCFYLTFGLYLIAIFFNLFLVFVTKDFLLDSLLKSSFSLFTISLSFMFFYAYSLELLFMKANKRWWAALIPIYNLMILSEMAFKKKSLGLISLIPFIGYIYILVVFYKIGEKFKYNGILTALFSIFMIPVIAYGNHPYDGRTFISDDEKNPIEVEYRRKNIFLGTTLIFFIIGIGLLIYGNMTKVENTSNNIKNIYYVYAAKKMVKKTKDSIEKGELTCDTAEFKDGVYYVYLEDVGDELNLFLQMFREPLEGYVKIIKNGEKFNYYVSLTDGIQGFSETNIEEINSSIVVNYKELNNIYKSIGCYLS